MDRKITTFAQIQEEYAKCLLDTSRKYMIENYLSTYDATQKKTVPFKLLPRQVVLVEALRDYDNVITVKSRQEGITTTFAALMACEMVLASKESPENVLCVGNKLDLSQQMITKIKEFIKQLPRWFFGDEYFSFDPKDIRNNDKKTPVFSLCNKNEICLSYNNSMAHARSSGENAARGISAVSRLVFDECAFIDNAMEVYASCVPTVSTGGKITLISTPNGKDSLYYGTYANALAGRNNFHIVESRWHQDPRYNKYLKWVKTDKETGNVQIYEEPTIDRRGNVAYKYEEWQKRLADGWKPESPWYIKMCNSFNNDRIRIAQELDVSFLGSANNVIEPEYIAFQQMNNVRDPLYKDKFDEDFWIWKEPMDGHHYIIAVDASSGSADDRTAIEVIDITGEDENGIPIIEQVAEYNGRLIGDEAGELVNKYGRAYNNAYCIVECIGGYGDAVVITLMRLKYPNLYYDDPALKSYTVQKKFIEYNMSPDEQLPGFHSSSCRYQMLANFAKLVKNNEFKIRSNRVITELDTWIFKGAAARMDHMDGKHDDTITCLAMGLFVMEFSYFKMEETKNKDKAILSSWVVNSGTTYTQSPVLKEKSVSIAPKPSMAMPFYNAKMLEETRKAKDMSKQGYSSNLWLFSSVLK